MPDREAILSAEEVARDLAALDEWLPPLNRVWGRSVLLSHEALRARVAVLTEERDFYSGTATALLESDRLLRAAEARVAVLTGERDEAREGVSLLAPYMEAHGIALDRVAVLTEDLRIANERGDEWRRLLGEADERVAVLTEEREAERERFLALGRFVEDALSQRGLLSDPKIEVALPRALDRIEEAERRAALQLVRIKDATDAFTAAEARVAALIEERDEARRELREFHALHIDEDDRVAVLEAGLREARQEAKSMRVQRDIALLGGVPAAAPDDTEEGRE